MRTRLGLLLLLAIAGLSRPSLAGDPWDEATTRDAAGQPIRRFIPPELYTGAPWDGDRTLVLRPVEVTRKPMVPSDHPPISFTGPIPWGDPPIMVIKRSRTSGRRGSVDQVFAINERGDGLGRVEDRRAGRVRQGMAECFKFPLGEWREGEERKCRDSVIKILAIDFTYGSIAHALKFHWNNEGIYVFAPGYGMVAVEHAGD